VEGRLAGHFLYYFVFQSTLRMNPDHLFQKTRRWIVLFIFGLILSGATAFAQQTICEERIPNG